jgi:hypothetical protein
MRRIAYQIKDAVLAEPFVVYFSHNAWWMDRGKVQSLMRGFKTGFTTQEACNYAGISLYQCRYFRETHPEFSPVKRRCQSLLSIVAKERLAKDLETSPETRRWYLERKEPGTYGRARAMRPNFERQKIMSRVKASDSSNS